MLFTTDLHLASWKAKSQHVLMASLLLAPCVDFAWSSSKVLPSEVMVAFASGETQCCCPFIFSWYLSPPFLDQSLNWKPNWEIFHYFANMPSTWTYPSLKLIPDHAGSFTAATGTTRTCTELGRSCRNSTWTMLWMESEGAKFNSYPHWDIQT